MSFDRISIAQQSEAFVTLHYVLRFIHLHGVCTSASKRDAAGPTPAVRTIEIRDEADSRRARATTRLNPRPAGPYKSKLAASLRVRWS